MKKKIFILLNDYSLPNVLANFGVHLAKALQAPLVLFGIENMTYPAVPQSITGTGIPYRYWLNVKEIVKNATPHLLDIQEKLQETWEHVHYDVALGDPEKKIIQLTKEKDPELLIVEGQSNLSNINEWFGTYETKIAEGADCPILVVPPDTQWKPIKKILYIMDMEDSKMNNLKILNDLAQRLHAHLQIVVISEKTMDEVDGSYRRMVDTFKHILKYKKPTFYRIFADKSADEVINIINAVSPDWFAFEQKDKNFFERVFESYHTKRLILEADRPVLVL